MPPSRKSESPEKIVEPNSKQFKQLASYKVAEGGTHAYPVLSGNRIFIKDRDAVTLWTTE